MKKEEIRNLGSNRATNQDRLRILTSLPYN